jgi:hemoglobin
LYERVGEKAGLLKLLRHFYADVRQHRTIGPIFSQHINDWPTHIAKIAEFWARATGGPSSYSGAMPAKHLELRLASEHFQAWLDLWDYNCRRLLPHAEASEMSGLAHSIGARLHSIVTGAGGLQLEPAPRPDQ